MATRSMIGIQTEDGVRAVYCHFDGYPDGVGETLKQFYDTPQRVEDLLSFGHLSSLGPQLPSDKEKNMTDEEKGKIFGWPEGVTKPYHLWRGEELMIDWFSLPTYFDKDFDHMGEEYRYLFVDGQWVVFKVYQGKLEIMK